tara:strand:- start:765 stop:2024 length:1260 start_codon:yes stop_codon:yes gene_type:complete
MIKDYDFRDFAGAAARAFNTLRFEPDKGLNQALQTIQQQRTANRAKNKTVEYLKSLGTPMGDRLAAMVLTDQLKGSQAYGYMFDMEREARAAQRADAVAQRNFENQIKLANINRDANFANQVKLANMNRDANFADQKELVQLNFDNAIEKIGIQHANAMELQNTKTTKPLKYQAIAADALRLGIVDNEVDAIKYALKETASKGNTTIIGGGKNEQVFNAVKDSADAATKALVSLNSLKEAKQAAANMFTGVAAEQRLQIAKLMAFTGINSFDEAIQNTEVFKTQIAPQVAFLLKQTVGSTQVSDADRSFAQEAAAGKITFDGTSINRVLDIMERLSNEVVNSHRVILNAVYPEGDPTVARERALFGTMLRNDAAPSSTTQQSQPTVNNTDTSNQEVFEDDKGKYILIDRGGGVKVKQRL